MFTEANLAILDALTGSRVSTLAMVSGGWVGAEATAGGGGGTQPVQLAQAQGGAQARPMPRGGVALPERLPGGRVRIGPHILSAAQLLQELQSRAEQRQVGDALARFGLDRNDAVDVLAARAYVWSRNFAWLNYRAVPASGPVNDRVAEAIMRHERDNPGTLGQATRGDRRAGQALNAVVEAAVAGQGIRVAPQSFARTSAVHPALSTTSARARAVVGIREWNGSWQVHHLIPFAVVAAMPRPAQMAIAASGWQMDSAENLIALPANMPTYIGAPNFEVLPIHNGPHPAYQAQASRLTEPVARQARSMSKDQIRRALRAIESALIGYLMQRVRLVHPELR